MRERWVGWERWLRERWGSTVTHIMHWWKQHAANTMKSVRQRKPCRATPPVATVVGDVLQVDPIEAVHWHRAWLAYLDAKMLDVELRQATHRALVAEEDT